LCSTVSGSFKSQSKGHKRARGGRRRYLLDTPPQARYPAIQTSSFAAVVVPKQQWTPRGRSKATRFANARSSRCRASGLGASPLTEGSGEW
jgi:hypothetical protein